MKSNPEQQVKYGHIAALLREKIKERGWTPAQFSDALGLKPKATLVYGWLAGRNAPGHAIAGTVAKLLGVPPSALRMRPPQKMQPVARDIIALAANRPPVLRQEPVLTFRANGDGSARITLDVSLPVAHAMPLLRTLLDAGIIQQQQQPQGE